MKKRNLVVFILVLALCLALTTSSSWAGSAQRHRWQGVAIGIGAAVLGSALYHQYREPRSAHEPVYCNAPPPPHRSRVVVRTPGHWEIERTWIPGETERVWREGYYDRYGRWHPGYWEKSYRTGHWVEKEVWVEGPPRLGRR